MEIDESNLEPDMFPPTLTVDGKHYEAGKWHEGIEVMQKANSPSTTAVLNHLGYETIEGLVEDETD